MNEHRRTLTTVHAWLLALLLLLAQAAGLAHRISHPQTGGRAASALAAAQTATAGGEHQSGSADCRLIDQLMHADALCTGVQVPAALALPFETAVPPQADAPGAAAQAAYLARAPPRG